VRERERGRESDELERNSKRNLHNFNFYDVKIRK
jgi:hypothetical protein